MSSKNPEIKAAIDSFDLSRARDLLREAMPEANAETFYLASRAALDDEQRLEFLERAVALDPFHEAARTALRQMKSAGSAPAASAAAPPAAPGGAPASATHETSRYVRALGVHKFRADIPVEPDIALIDSYFTGLGYKRKRGENIAYSKPITSVGGVGFGIKVTTAPGNVSAIGECYIPARWKHLTDLVKIDALIRTELEGLAATLVGGQMSIEQAVQAQVDLEQSILQSRKEWIREQNSPMQIVLVVVGVVIFLLLFSSGFWESLLGAFF